MVPTIQQYIIIKVIFISTMWLNINIEITFMSLYLFSYIYLHLWQWQQTFIANQLYVLLDLDTAMSENVSSGNRQKLSVAHYDFIASSYVYGINLKCATILDRLQVGKENFLGVFMYFTHVPYVCYSHGWLESIKPC